MDEIIGFLKGFSIQTIITLAVMMWYFSYHIEKKIDKLDLDLKRQGERTDKLYEMFIDLLKSQKNI
jgi:hypothetical protein